MSRSFQAVAAYRGLATNLVGQGDPEHLEGASVTADLFPLLGVKPALGRLFTAADDRDGAPGTVLLSYGLWKSHFGGDTAVLGQKMMLDDRPYSVIGVMPPNLYFPTREARLWTAMRFAEQEFEDRNNTFLEVIARLGNGVSLDQSTAEMALIAAQLKRAYPKENAHTGARVIRLRDEVSQQSRLLLAALFGAATCVLLIACTNLANLLLARALVRRQELSVRIALGAGRERLIRQLLTESVVLAVLGGALGVYVALGALPLLARLVPTSLPIAEVPSIDLRMLVFAALATAVTGIGFGVVPAWQALGSAALAGLREGSRGGVGGRRERIRSALVIAELAISTVLLISSGLLIRALWRLQSTDPGFRSEGVLTLRTALPMPKYEKTAPRVQFYSRVLSEIRALPGVSGAAYISFLPMVMRGGIWPVIVEGRPQDPAESNVVSLRFVTPGFFATLGIPLRQGRDVSESDNAQSPLVAVVSESFAKRYWPGADPLRRRFRCAFHDRTVVGVVSDIRVRGLERSSEPQVYLPCQQVPDGDVTWYAPKDLVIRSSVETAMLLPAVRRIVRNVDVEQPISSVRMLSDIVEAETGPRQVQVRVLGSFAAIACILAGVGIYGLLSFAVSQRAPEIGVRMALGAQSSQILTMFLREGMALAAAGIALGLALAYAAARAMQALLAGVRPADTLTFSTAVGLSLALTIIASLYPALRAARVDPASVIRAE